MSFKKHFTAKSFFCEFEKGPDLRRLGEYTVTENVDLRGKIKKPIHFGNGTFNKPVFLGGENCQSIHLDTSTFKSDVDFSAIIFEDGQHLFFEKANFEWFVNCGNNKNLTLSIYYHKINLKEKDKEMLTLTKWVM